MDPQVKQILTDWLRTMGVQGRAAQANPTAQMVTALLNGSKLPAVQMAALLNAARQSGINLPPGALSGLVSDGGQQDQTALPDPQNGPALTSGTGQNLSLADRAAAAAAAAARQAGGVGKGLAGGASAAATASTATPTPASQPPMTAGGPGGTVPGGFSGAQGEALGQDDNMLVRFAMQAAGLNPDRMTHFSKIAQRALEPLVQARRAAFGLLGGGQNVGGLPQDIANFAGEFTRGGADFFGNAQNYAQQVMGGDLFKNAVAGLNDQDQVQALYASLMPLMYAGANPLVQQSAADTLRRNANQFNDADFLSLGGQAPKPGGGVFMDWLNGRQNDPITRRIFGLR